MNHRDRLLTALRHRQPDRVPYDLKFTAPKLDEFMKRTGAADPFVYFDLDYRYVPIRAPRALPDFSGYFRGRVPDWPDFDDSALLETTHPGAAGYFVMGPHNTAMNEWGEYRLYGEPVELNYHKKVHPLQGPDCTLGAVEQYPYPDLFAEYRYAGIEKIVKNIQAQGLAAALSWEMTIFEKAWRIRGMEDLMMDFVSNPDLAECLLDQIAKRTGYLAMRYARAGVDVIQLGDDIGSQNAMMISPKTWRRFLKPRLAKIIADTKAANPDVLIFYHSDGKYEAVIPDLIEIGVDILNPVQPESMEIANLKRQYGERLCFWGGIGVQTTMPFGTPDDVRAAVRKLMADAGDRGGLVVSPAHVLEPDVPWDNIVAFVEAARQYGLYS